MEKIIASKVEPNGFDQEIISFLEGEDKLLDARDIIYYGFPIFRDYEDQVLKPKILLLSKKYGLLMIYSTSKNNIDKDDDYLSQLYSFIETSLKRSNLLRKSKRELSFTMEAILFCHNGEGGSNTENELIKSMAGLKDFIVKNERSDIDDKQFEEIRSIIEGAKCLSKPVKRESASSDPRLKSNIVRELENEIANFDVEQRTTAISLVDGPQRIRGLAGSGKTIVLAMKAAHIHLEYPDKKILFTFHTKSLYGLIKDSISRFYRHFSGVEPDWNMINIYHAWGGKNLEGVAYNACIDNNINPLSFVEAKNINPSDPFKNFCAYIIENKISDKYHYILIDEAQDLPNEFFRLCYLLAYGDSGKEKNIVWAYDDLQSIFKVYQRTPQELFGKDNRGTALIDLDAFASSLSNIKKNDFVLRKCYRNPLDVLVTAHALGFGIYANEPPVQMLENKEHWEDVGYVVEKNMNLAVGQETKITRKIENSPLSIHKYQNKNDLIEQYEASSIDDEIDWVVKGIRNSLNEGLKPHEIMVISLDDRYAKKYFLGLSKKLSSMEIKSNNLLMSYSAAPPFSIDDMITLSTVHRAKGNEAAEVYVIGIDAIYDCRNSRSARNKLFTAFTRTKAWLKVSGFGDRAKYFFREIDKSLVNSPSLIFDFPDISRIETIQRDLSNRAAEFSLIKEQINNMEQKGFSREQIMMELSLYVEGEKDEKI